MSRLIMPISVLLLLIPFGPSTQAQQATLDIYWIDVEGGAATLIVTPEQESILMDAPAITVPTSGMPRVSKRQ